MNRGEAVAQTDVTNDFSYLIVAGEGIGAGEYTMWQGENQLKGMASGGMGGGMPGGKMERPEEMEFPEEM